MANVISAVSAIETNEWSKLLRSKGQIFLHMEEAAPRKEFEHGEQMVRLYDWAKRMGLPVDCPDNGDYVRVRRKAA